MGERGVFKGKYPCRLNDMVSCIRVLTDQSDMLLKVFNMLWTGLVYGCSRADLSNFKLCQEVYIE